MQTGVVFYTKLSWLFLHLDTHKPVKVTVTAWRQKLHFKSTLHVLFWSFFTASSAKLAPPAVRSCKSTTSISYRIIKDALFYTYAFNNHISLTKHAAVRLLKALSREFKGMNSYSDTVPLLQRCSVLCTLQPHHNMIMPMWIVRGVGMVKWWIMINKAIA